MKNQIITFWTLLILSTTATGAQDETKTPAIDWTKIPTSKSSDGEPDKKDPIWLVEKSGHLTGKNY